MPTMMEGEGENGPSNCSWEVYLGAEAFCWYRYALLFRPSTPIQPSLLCRNTLHRIVISNLAWNLSNGQA